MTKHQIDVLAARSRLPDNDSVQRVEESLISWIVIGSRFAYKIKKPVHFTFLDYSSIERRKVYCLHEFYLNRRLAHDMYIDVVPVTRSDGEFEIDGEGELADYAVKMKTMDDRMLMSNLLNRDMVSTEQIRALAHKIAQFHKDAKITYCNDNYDLTEKFDDIRSYLPYLSAFVAPNICQGVINAAESFRVLSSRFSGRLIERVNHGFFRDCHGDLHSGNIYLDDEAVPFDCIEFDSTLREIDVLNEVAFMCMDLEYYGKPDLSHAFFETYNLHFPAVLSVEDGRLYVLYKSYRANVRAKVNILKAQAETDSRIREEYIQNCIRLIKSMNTYLQFASTRQLEAH